MNAVEKTVGKSFGDPKNPLFVSCRSGAKFSMPGMMDTVLNIGLNDETAKGMIELTGDPRFVYDSYRRLIQMFGSVVMGVADEPFEEVIAEQKKKKGIKHDVELTAEDWQFIIERFKALVKAYKGIDFPQDPYKQLEMATRAVFNSWFGKRAIDYRNATNISHDLGTAVNIVTMVFGNMGDDSRHRRRLHPQPGRRRHGTLRRLPDQRPGRRRGGRHPQHAAHCAAQAGHARSLCRVHGHRHQAREPLPATCRTWSSRSSASKLWMLQTRNGKRTARAAIKMAVDMANEGLITEKEGHQARHAGAGGHAPAPAVLRRNQEEGAQRRQARS